MTGNLAITPLARLNRELSFLMVFLCQKNDPHFFLSTERGSTEKKKCVL